MNFQYLLSVFVMCEIFELFYVQKGNTVSFYIANLIFLYKRGVIWFLCSHPSFYAAIFAAIYTNNYGILAMILIVFKALDIAVKLALMQKIENEESLGMFAYMIEQDTNISFLLKAGVSLFYAALFYMAFNPYA
ncbi:MAG: hypothetical protein LBT96_04185 [Campylobacteraceae bacterium]|jgi:hypothetical protein|nr:hypothetical protein [Campylobacteraceae bacterium]